MVHPLDRMQLIRAGGYGDAVSHAFPKEYIDADPTALVAPMRSYLESKGYVLQPRSGQADAHSIQHRFEHSDEWLTYILRLGFKSSENRTNLYFDISGSDVSSMNLAVGMLGSPEDASAFLLENIVKELVK